VALSQPNLSLDTEGEVRWVRPYSLRGSIKPRRIPEENLGLTYALGLKGWGRTAKEAETREGGLVAPLSLVSIGGLVVEVRCEGAIAWLQRSTVGHIPTLIPGSLTACSHSSHPILDSILDAFQVCEVVMISSGLCDGYSCHSSPPLIRMTQTRSASYPLNHAVSF
jgi:hypothetical protein